MTFQWAVATHRGRVRQNNEDSVHPTTSGRGSDLLVIVADGMGGAVAGEVASSLAVEAAVSATGSEAELVAAGNEAILDAVAARPELAGMGSTLTLVRLDDGTARFAHVGDSRAYLLRDGSLTQVTEDHTVVNDYLRAGAISPDEVDTHPQRHMLTRAVGLDPDLAVDSFTRRLEQGDRLLVCSDGLTGMLSDDDIAGILTGTTPEEAVWELVERANAAGGQDNITVVVVDVER